MSKLELTSGQIRDLSESTWILALDYAKDNGVGITKNDVSGHTVTVKGGVSKFIRQAAKELDLRAYVTGENGANARKAVRTYLRARYNVVALNQDGAYTWRIFVASNWNENPREEQAPHVISRAVSRDVDRLTQGESGPVKSVNLWEEFREMPLGPAQAFAIKTMFENGGRYRDDSGFVSRDLFGRGQMAHSVSEAENRNLLKVIKKHSKAYKEISLTQRGWWVAERLSYCQTASVALAAFMSKVGSFAGSSPTKTTSELAERIHKDASSTTNAIRDLESQGMIAVERNTETGPYHRIKWTGNGSIPGVHIEETALPVIEDDPEDVPVNRAELAATATGPVAARQPAAPVPDQSGVDSPTFTTAQARAFMDAMIEAVNDGPDPDAFKKFQGAVEKSYAMCKDVESGKVSALRAVTEIMELTGEVLS